MSRIALHLVFITSLTITAGSIAVENSVDVFEPCKDIWTVREVLCEHHTEIKATVFSPNGGEFVSVGDDSKVIVWDLTYAKSRAWLRGHREHVNSAAWSADGKYIVTASGNYFAEDPKTKGGPSHGTESSIRMWNAETSACLLHIEKAHESATFYAALSPDGRKIISSGGDNLVKIWDAATAKEMNRFDGSSPRFSPDKTSIVLIKDHRAKIMDLDSQKMLVEFGDDKLQIERAEFSSDGKALVTAGADVGTDFIRTIRTWDTQSGKCTLLIRPDKIEDEIYRVSFSQDGSRLISGHSDSRARIWDAKTGKCLATFTTGGGAVMNPALSPDGNWLVFSNKFHQVILWQRKKVETPKDEL